MVMTMSENTFNFRDVDGFRGRCKCGNYFHFIDGNILNHDDYRDYIVCSDCDRKIQLEITAKEYEGDDDEDFFFDDE